MDREVIRTLYEQHASSVFNRAKRLLKDEESAWEATQDVFVKVMKSGGDFRRESSVWTWLYRITTNHCLNLIRSRKTWENIEGALKREIPTSSEKVPMENSFFVKVLETSGEKVQKIALAHYVEGMTHEEIAQTLRLSRKTVGKRLIKFEEKARKHLLIKKETYNGVPNTYNP